MSTHTVYCIHVNKGPPFLCRLNAAVSWRDFYEALHGFGGVKVLIDPASAYSSHAPSCLTAKVPGAVEHWPLVPNKIRLWQCGFHGVSLWLGCFEFLNGLVCDPSCHFFVVDPCQVCE